MNELANFFLYFFPFRPWRNCLSSLKMLWKESFWRCVWLMTHLCTDHSFNSLTLCQSLEHDPWNALVTISFLFFPVFLNKIGIYDIILYRLLLSICKDKTRFWDQSRKNTNWYYVGNVNRNQIQEQILVEHLFQVIIRAFDCSKNFIKFFICHSLISQPLKNAFMK